MVFKNLFKPTDLWSAVKSGNTKAIEELIAAGNDVNAKKSGFIREGYTPLHIAVLHEQKEAIKILAKHGANMNAKNNEGDTPLWTAVSELKNPETVELLLDLGAKIDSRKSDLAMTPLDWAAFDGKVEIVELLLKRGAKLDAGKGANRSAPIVQCAHNGNIDILRLLLKSGADVNTPHRGSFALDTAATCGHVEFVRNLLEAGADPNQSDEWGTTPLLCAVAGKKLEIVKMIVEAGAKLNAVRFGASPETALDFAEKIKNAEAIEYLKSIGAKNASELPVSEITPPPEASRGTDWQLRDDSIMEATFDPWPPKPGPAKVRVEISTNGYDPNIVFSGLLEYRIAIAKENSEPWIAMKRTGKDEEGNVRFSDSVNLIQGTFYVQFKVQPKWDTEATILKDWKIEIK